jgi:hypothetical protein
VVSLLITHSFARSIMDCVGSDPSDRKQMHGILVVDSLNTVRRSVMTDSANLGPRECEMYLDVGRRW